MKYIIALLVIGAFLIYLNRSYAYFFSYIGKKHLPNPNTQTKYVLKSSSLSDKYFTYVVLGDSLTAGVGATTFSTSYPYLVASRLATEQNINLIDLAKPGAQTAEVLQFQIQKVTPEADLVTVMVGTNDMLNQVPESDFRRNLTSILNQIKKNKPKQIFVFTIPYLASGKTLFFPYNFLMDFRIKRFNVIIEEIAKNEEIPVIDLYAKSKNDFNQNSRIYYSQDEFHPSNSGYAYWADIIYADLTHTSTTSN